MANLWAPAGVETFSLVLRTAGGGAAGGGELRRCYVEGELALEKRRTQLSHWGFYCECERCQAEEVRCCLLTKTPTLLAPPRTLALALARTLTLKPSPEPHP